MPEFAVRCVQYIMNNNVKRVKTGVLTMISMILLVLFPVILILGNDIEMLSVVQDMIEKISLFGGVDLLLVYSICSFGIALAVLIQTLKNDKSARKALSDNMLLHVLQMPAYIMVGIESVICIITIFTIGISIGLMVFCGFSICASGLLALGGIWKASKEGIWRKGIAILYSILSFTVCVDVIVAIIMYVKIKKYYKNGDRNC